MAFIIGLIIGLIVVLAVVLMLCYGGDEESGGDEW
jgi:hypothetical protein